MAIFFFNSFTLTLSFAILVLVHPVNSLNFKITRFDNHDSTNIQYQGDAVPSVGAVELINKLTYVCRVGWATYGDPVQIWDSNSGKSSDFSTHFSFIIDTQNSSSYGHGIVFFLAPIGFQIPPNSAGGFLGLFNTSTSDSSLNQIVTVEFDSFPNPEWDPPVEHVGINNNSIASAVYTPWNASFHSGDTADAWITYNSTSKNLSVSWSYQITKNPGENLSLSYIIDLSKVLPEKVNIGFSSTTGLNGERATLLSWEFNSSLDIKEIHKNSSRKVKIVVGVSVSGFLIIIGSILIISWKRKKSIIKRKAKTTDFNSVSINEDLEKGAGPRRFSYQELVSATNNFSTERKLGEGGFGAVYKGYLKDIDTAVAVKKFSRGSKQGKKEYLTEVKTISQLRHRNLVQLIGWCHDKGEFLLVYEFMPNRSLDSHLFGKRSSLTGALRYKISLGLASSLLYLHEECEQCVVHRDVKSSNIMLDSSFNVKLGDFGLARIMDHEVDPQTTGLAGTLGYLAPEYISTGRASKDSDVYSFGVVVLEIFSGRKASVPIRGLGLVEWIWDLYGNGEILSGIDKRINLEYDKVQLECLVCVGLWCAHPDASARPSIRQAIQVLNFEADLPELPAKMPVPVFCVPTTPSVSSGEPLISDSSLAVGR